MLCFKTTVTFHFLLLGTQLVMKPRQPHGEARVEEG